MLIVTVLIVIFLKPRLFCNFPVKLLLIVNLGFFRISRRKTPIYGSFSTKNSLLRLWILANWLIWILRLLSYLVLIINTVYSSLSMLAHRNELLIWISILIALLSAYQLSHLVKLIDHILTWRQNIMVSDVLIAFFLINCSLVAIGNAMLVQYQLKFLIDFILSFVPVHKKSIFVLPAPLKHSLGSSY